jgi:hypothetical protein
MRIILTIYFYIAISLELRYSHIPCNTSILALVMYLINYENAIICNEILKIIGKTKFKIILTITLKIILTEIPVKVL